MVFLISVSIGRDVYDPLQTHGYRIIIYKGVKHNPRGDKQTTYSFRMK